MIIIIYVVSLIKKKDEEIEDLQIQFHSLKKIIENEGGKIFQEVKKCSRENDNLVSWLKVYDDQIKSYQKEIYNLNLKLYFSSQSQPPQQPQQPQQSLLPSSQSSQSPQPSQHFPLQQQSVSLSNPPSPQFKTLADYFKNQK